MIATGVNKTRRRGPLFFTCFSFSLQTKQKTKPKLKQTSKQKDSGTRPRWKRFTDNLHKRA